MRHSYCPAAVVYGRCWHHIHKFHGSQEGIRRIREHRETHHREGGHTIPPVLHLHDDVRDERVRKTFRGDGLRSEDYRYRCRLVDMLPHSSVPHCRRGCPQEPIQVSLEHHAGLFHGLLPLFKFGGDSGHSRMCDEERYAQGHCRFRDSALLHGAHVRLDDKVDGDFRCRGLYVWN